MTQKLWHRSGISLRISFQWIDDRLQKLDLFVCASGLKNVKAEAEALIKASKNNF